MLLEEVIKVYFWGAETVCEHQSQDHGGLKGLLSTPLTAKTFHLFFLMKWLVDPIASRIDLAHLLTHVTSRCSENVSVVSKIALGYSRYNDKRGIGSSEWACVRHCNLCFNGFLSFDRTLMDMRECENNQIKLWFHVFVWFSIKTFPGASLNYLSTLPDKLSNPSYSNYWQIMTWIFFQLEFHKI